MPHQPTITLSIKESGAPPYPRASAPASWSSLPTPRRSSTSPGCCCALPAAIFWGWTPSLPSAACRDRIRSSNPLAGSCGPGPCACSSWPALPRGQPSWTTSGRRRRSSGPYPARMWPSTPERCLVDGCHQGEEPGDLIGPAPDFAHSSGSPRVGPTGLPRCVWAPSTPGRLGYRAAG